MALLEFKNVSFKYICSNQFALNNVSFSLNEGQIVGLLGPNGSGKTTIIKLINGLLRNYQGEILVNNEELSEKSRAIISYLPDSTYLNENSSIEEAIELFKNLYDDFDKEKMINLLSKMHIEAKSIIKTLSKGNKEKLQLALVLSRNAKIYILDEPIGGVDPAKRDFIIQTILSNYAKNSLVIISTHLLEDIEPILNRTIMIKNGEVVIDDTKDNIINTHNNKSLNDIFKEVFKC